jgi:integrase
MDPRALLDDWLASGTLRPSTIHARYRPEVTSWLDWCEKNSVHPYHADIRHVAKWCEDEYLRPYLGDRPFDGPEALAYLVETAPQICGSHDGRITSVTQYYIAAHNRGLVKGVPNLLDLRAGVDRDPGEPRKLTQEERDAFLSAVGGWGPEQRRHYLRDRLIAYLLLEGLRPGEVVRLDIRHLYEQPDGTFDIRTPDDFENVGKKHTLGLLASEALREYLPARITPVDGVHTLIIGQGGKPIVSRYPNMLVQEIASLRTVLAQRRPPVTADALAHTGKRDTSDTTK